MTDLPVWYLTVTRTQQVTPHLMRVVLTGEDLAGLSVVEPDQQVKLYFPRPGQDRPLLPSASENTEVMGWYGAYNAIPESQRPWMRSYTIRWYDQASNTIAFDFVLHRHAGPATQWALNARPGDVLGVFGPSAAFARRVPLSKVLGEADYVLLAGDDSAIPAISTVIESLPVGKPALAYLEVEGRSDELDFTSEADLSVTWLHRGDVEPGRSDLLVPALREAILPEGQGFAFVAAEAATTRQMRRHLVQERRFPKPSVDFTGYWRLALTQDDAPTSDDLAEAQERLAELQAQSS